MVLRPSQIVYTVYRCISHSQCGFVYNGTTACVGTDKQYCDADGTLLVGDDF